VVRKLHSRPKERQGAAILYNDPETNESHARPAHEGAYSWRQGHGEKWQRQTWNKLDNIASKETPASAMAPSGANCESMSANEKWSKCDMPTGLAGSEELFM
jgi:hypothetical protein